VQYVNSIGEFGKPQKKVKGLIFEGKQVEGKLGLSELEQARFYPVQQQKAPAACQEMQVPVDY